jgi:hypothetical protein
MTTENSNSNSKNDGKVLPLFPSQQEQSPVWWRAVKPVVRQETAERLQKAGAVDSYGHFDVLGVMGSLHRIALKQSRLLSLIVSPVITLAIFFAISALMGCGSSSEKKEPALPPVPVVQLSDTQVMEAFTLRLMDQCNTKHLSPARKAILVKQLSRITVAQLPTMEQRQSFVLLVCIESNFHSGARSKVGAVGLSQLMPQYAPSFAESCGLGKVTTEDLADAEVNLSIGSCHFAQLLQRFDGNVALALAAYNSGADSKTTRGLSRLQEGHPETGYYLAKYLVLQEKMK